MTSSNSSDQAWRESTGSLLPRVRVCRERVAGTVELVPVTEVVVGGEVDMMVVEVVMMEGGEVGMMTDVVVEVEGALGEASIEGAMKMSEMVASNVMAAIMT